MANNSPTTAQKALPMTPKDVAEAIKRGDFSMEDFLNALAGQRQYVRAGNSYRELKPENGASFINGEYCKCFRLGEKINSDGTPAPKRPRKKKAA